MTRKADSIPATDRLSCVRRSDRVPAMPVETCELNPEPRTENCGYRKFVLQTRHPGAFSLAKLAEKMWRERQFFFQLRAVWLYSPPRP